jgi:hypothetical protein
MNVSVSFSTFHAMLFVVVAILNFEFDCLPAVSSKPVKNEVTALSTYDVRVQFALTKYLSFDLL